MSPVKKKILDWALGVGKKHRAEMLAGKTPGGLSWKMANKLVFSKIREAFGGRADGVYLGRRAAGDGYGGVVCGCGDSDL